MTATSLMAIGDSLPERSVGPFSALDFAAFSTATADPNRVHIEHEMALAAGLPSVIGSGGIVIGVIIEFVVSAVGRHRLRSASLRMPAPLFPGSTLHVRGEVVAQAREGSTIQVTAADDDGKVIGQASVVVADAESLGDPRSAGLRR